MTFWTRRHPKARVSHECELCGRRIDPGEVYTRGVGIDGTAWTWKECAHCTRAQTIYDLSWDGEYNAECFQDWAGDGGPRDIEEARAMAGYRKRWRTARGNLWPLPTRTT